MLVVHVRFRVAEHDRQRALDALMANAPATRAMKGCLAFVPFLDPTDGRGIGVLHEWQTGEDFAAYAASPGFAETSAILRPLMTEPPLSRRFDARLIETLN
ncbi:putative quinol monooxygenase [Rhizobium sp. CAU 1783]